MQLTSSVYQRTNSVMNIPADSPVTHTLVYRGVTYQIPQQRVSRAAQEQARLAQLIGKRLIYRGATCGIVRTSIPEAIAPKPMHRLIYRGTTYLKAV
jgi:hypothetical protein